MTTIRRIVTMRDCTRMELQFDTATGATCSRWLHLPAGLSPDELAAADVARLAALRRFAKQNRILPTVTTTLRRIVPPAIATHPPEEGSLP